MKKLGIIVLTLFFLAIVARAFGAYPDYKGYVNDFANVISPEKEEALQQKLNKEDRETTNQIAVVTIQTTAPEEIEGFSINLAEQWQPGQKGKDNGILMIFAMKDRKMRIEVGRGLEDDLTDIEAKEIEEDIIVPAFKQQKYEQGIEGGVDAVILAIHTADEAASSSAATNGDSGAGALIIFLIIGGLIVLVVLAVSKYTPIGGEGDSSIRGIWVPRKGSRYGKKSFGEIKTAGFIPIVPPVIMSHLPIRQTDASPSEEPEEDTRYIRRSARITGVTSPSYNSDDDDDYSSSNSSSSSSGWGGISFGGGSFSGGGASSGW